MADHSIINFDQDAKVSPQVSSGWPLVREDWPGGLPGGVSDRLSVAAREVMGAAAGGPLWESLSSEMAGFVGSVGEMNRMAELADEVRRVRESVDPGLFGAAGAVGDWSADVAAAAASTSMALAGSASELMEPLGWAGVTSPGEMSRTAALERMQRLIGDDLLPHRSRCDLDGREVAPAAPSIPDRGNELDQAVGDDLWRAFRFSVLIAWFVMYGFLGVTESGQRLVEANEVIVRLIHDLMMAWLAVELGMHFAQRRQSD